MRHPVESKIDALTAIAFRIMEAIPEGGSGGSSALGRVFSEAHRLTEMARALRDLRATPNPTETEGARTKRVATAAQKFTKEIEATRERVKKIVAEGLKNVEAQIKAKTQLEPDAYASEVRATFRGMTQTEKLKLLNDLLEEGRGSEFAAIVRAPRTVTGMQEEMRQHYETAFIARHAAPELLDRKALSEVLETANVVAHTAGEIAAMYNDPGTLADIARAEAAAATAAKNFDAAVAP